MNGGGLGERKNACSMNPLLFITAFAGERKTYYWLILSNSLIVSCTIASKTTNSSRRAEDVLARALRDF